MIGDDDLLHDIMSRYCRYSLAVILAAHHTPSTPGIQVFRAAHIPSTRSISDVSTSIPPVLAVRKVLDNRAVLSPRVYVRFLLCNAAAAAGMYTCSHGTRPRRQDVAYTVMLLLMMTYGYAAVPQLML